MKQSYEVCIYELLKQSADIEQKMEQLRALRESVLAAESHQFFDAAMAVQTQGTALRA